MKRIINITMAYAILFYTFINTAPLHARHGGGHGGHTPPAPHPKIIIAENITRIFSPNDDGFLDEVTIRYKTVPKNADVTAEVQDDDGNSIQILTLHNSWFGLDSVTWNGRNTAGAVAAEGKYFLYYAQVIMVKLPKNGYGLLLM